MKTINFRYVAVLATAISLTACSFSSLDVDKKAHDYGYNVADEDGYIKSFNAGTVKSVETKTMFHTEPDEYGLTTWEPGYDKLSFILRDPEGQFAYNHSPEKWQIFGCDESFTRDNDIKWAKYSVIDNIGLQVDENYYAYYMDGREEEAIVDFLAIDQFDQNGQSDESLQNFMRHYDILVLEEDQHGCPTKNGGLIIQTPMHDVYMDHYFSLIEVDVHWVANPLVKDKETGISERKNYVRKFNKVEFGSGADPEDESDEPQEILAFAGLVALDGYGELKLSEETSFVTNNRIDGTDALRLNEENNLLKYYMLIHPIKSSNHYWIKVYAEGQQRTIHYELPQYMMFKPGYYYKFDLEADFSGMTVQTAKNWQDRGRLRDRDSKKYEDAGIYVYDQNN